MKKYITILFIIFCVLFFIPLGFAGYQIYNLQQKNFLFSIQLEKTVKENAILASRIDSLTKEVSDLKKVTSPIASIDKGKTSIFDSMIVSDSKAPTQSGEVKKINDCQNAVREKYYDIRVAECAKLGFESDIMNEMFRSHPEGCVLQDKIHNDLYQREMKEGKACGDNFYFPNSY
jgi:hypothetical protein